MLRAKEIFSQPVLGTSPTDPTRKLWSKNYFKKITVHAFAWIKLVFLFYLMATNCILSSLYFSNTPIITGVPKSRTLSPG
jgi:hypothetical protein